MFKKDINDIFSKLKGAGFQCYIIGGAVRDLVLGEDADDYDFVTDATPTDIAKLFKVYTMANSEVNGVSMVLINGEVYEVATMRMESSYSDGRRPDEVVFVQDLALDVKRRDLTINAMAMDEDGKIIDFYDGQGDIKRKLIRMVGNPSDRIKEDGLRALRVLRFASKLKFSIDPKVIEAINQNINSLSGLSQERVMSEILKLMSAGYSQEVWEVLNNSPKISQYISNRLGLSHHFSGIYRQLDCKDWDINQIIYQIALLDEGVRDWDEWLHTLKISRKDMGIILCLKDLGEAKTDDECKQLLFKSKSHVQQDILKLGKYKHLQDSMPIFSLKELKVNGNDIMGYGYTGKEIKVVLDTIVSKVLSGKLKNERNELLEFLKKVR